MPNETFNPDKRMQWEETVKENYMIGSIRKTVDGKKTETVKIECKSCILSIISFNFKM